MQNAPKETIDETKKPPKEDGTWEEDQNKHGYYYDDAHGYEVFKPEDDEAEDADAK